MTKKGTTPFLIWKIKKKKKKEMGFFDKPEVGERIISTNDFAHNKNLPNNKVVNSKYTILTFLPLILWAHLKRFMNLYFIIIGTLQLWDAVTPVNPLTTWLPIVIIYAIAFVREGIDDFRQHQQDKVTNERAYTIIRDGKRFATQSQDIYPGDILLLRRGEECPCDICLLYSTNHDGKCCIETANLDGETNLKERFAPKQTQQFREDEFTSTRIIIRCSPPDAHLYQFDSTLFINDMSSQGIGVNEQQLIQHGVTLKNVDMIFGLVCYTGKQTKLALNSKAPPIKWTQIEKLINKVSICIFIAQIVLAIISGSVGNWKKSELEKTEHYLRLEDDKPIAEGAVWLILYIRCYLLTSIMIPVSLKVTIDICKYVYATWIRNDKKIYDAKREQRALVNNTSVIEDLGQIEYIFTDKTGTLTENEMKLKKLAVGTVYYGHSSESEDLLSDNSFVQAINDGNREVINAIICLAVCHTVKIIETGDNKTEFEGVSPEEVSFLSALLSIGIKLRMNEDVIEISSNQDKVHFEPMRFKIAYVLPFSFTRRRMSVIVQNLNTNSYILYSKGAHEKITEHCSMKYDEINNQVDTFASLGLRVMALSYKAIIEEEIAELNRQIQEAHQRTTDRVAALESAYESIENGQILLGCTGIEDSLQEGVPQTIEMLREGGIKVWMVTGDLMNTAIKIARSTRLISNDGELIHLSTEKAKVDPQTLLQLISNYVDGLGSRPFYLVIEGTSESTEQFLGPLKEEFAKLAAKARSVICARTMPKQKALYVEAIKATGKVTMAVGDGGNDVTMLRSAHIGIGIIGKEGKQAAVASDFAITQFQFIQRLLFIHGRYSAYRTSWLSQFCFYKSIMLALIQVSYMFFNGYSGVSFVNDFNLMCYNAIFTILPVIFFLFDKDVDDVTVYLHPFIYTDTRCQTFMNVRTCFWWIIRAIYQAVVISVIIFNVYDSEYINPLDGSPANLAEAQQVMYSSLILIVVITTTIDTQNFTSLNFIFIWGNWVLYLFCAAIANLIFDFSITRDMYLAVWRILADITSWCTIVVVTGVSTIPVLFIQSLFATYLPTRTQSLRSKEIAKEAKYLPVYVVQKDNVQKYSGESFEPALPETVWDKTHNIVAPLCTLLGCWKY